MTKQPQPKPLSKVDYRSVSERLSDRCDHLEQAVNQLLHNESVTIPKVTALEARPYPVTVWARLRWLVRG